MTIISKLGIKKFVYDAANRRTFKKGEGDEKGKFVCSSITQKTKEKEHIKDKSKTETKHRPLPAEDKELLREALEKTIKDKK